MLVSYNDPLWSRNEPRAVVVLCQALLGPGLDWLCTVHKECQREAWEGGHRGVVSNSCRKIIQKGIY